MSWEFDRVSMAETLEIPTGVFISDCDKVYPQSCLMCSSCFSVGFFPGVSPPRITTRWRVSPLYGIAHVKSTPKQMKISVWFNTSNNSWKCKCLKHTNVRICSHADPRKSQISSCYVYFRFFVIAADRENGTFSTINISKTIAGATGGDRSYWKSNK